MLYISYNLWPTIIGREKENRMPQHLYLYFIRSYHLRGSSFVFTISIIRKELTTKIQHDIENRRCDLFVSNSIFFVIFFRLSSMKNRKFTFI